MRRNLLVVEGYTCNPSSTFKPSTDKKLIVYLLISVEAISAVLVKEENSELRLYTSSVECYRIQKLDIR